MLTGRNPHCQETVTLDDASPQGPTLSPQELRMARAKLSVDAGDREAQSWGLLSLLS